MNRRTRFGPEDIKLFLELVLARKCRAEILRQHGYRWPPNLVGYVTRILSTGHGLQIFFEGVYPSGSYNSYCIYDRRGKSLESQQISELIAIYS